MHERKPLTPVEPARTAAAQGGLELEQGADGQLWARKGRERRAVHVCRCFPWSDPDRMLSLRDADDEEFALVREPAELDPASGRALRDALRQAGFVFEVTGIERVEEEVEIRVWEVRTEQGRRRFQTRRDDWPRSVPGGGLLIRDVGGDLFHIARPEALDRRSQDWLWAFVD